MKTLALTGATGFVGKATVDHALIGHYPDARAGRLPGAPTG